MNLLQVILWQLIVTKQILFHNSVDFIGYLRQAYRGFLSLPSVFKVLQVFLSVKLAQVTREVSISCTHIYARET